MQDWIKQIDQNTQAFQQHFGALDEEAINWKPSTDTWSIAQNIDHLIIINTSYFPLLEELKSGNYATPFLGRLGFVTNLLGKMILSSVQPGQQKKTATFPIWEPTTSQLPGDIVERFVQHQEKLKAKIQDTRELAEGGAVISSPANKNIVYKLATAFEIIVAHEQRHLQQALEVLDLWQNEN